MLDANPPGGGGAAPTDLGVTVCHVTVVHPALDDRIFYKECVSLARAGYEVHLVAPHDKDEVIEGVHIHALPKASGRLRRILLWPWKAYRQVRRISPRPRICHFHDPEFLPMGQLLRLRGYQAVFDVHENIPDQIRAKPYIPRWLRRVAAVTYYLLERVLTVGMPTVHVLESIACRYRGRRTVLRNLPHRRSSPLPAKARTSGPRRLVYLGGLDNDRGGIEMIQATLELCRRGIQTELLVIGPVLDGVGERMEQIAAATGMPQALRFTGQLPRREAMQRLADADLGLCLFSPTPNILNSLPVKLGEYMQAGLPVVASNFDCWRQYVTDLGTGVLVDPFDVPAIADAIQALLADPKRMAEMGQAGLKAVNENLCWENEEPKLVELYRQLLNR
jgi:glycosyltransferase involved in cell wall biosynthesis